MMNRDALLQRAIDFANKNKPSSGGWPGYTVAAMTAVCTTNYKSNVNLMVQFAIQFDGLETSEDFTTWGQSEIQLPYSQSQRESLDKSVDCSSFTRALYRIFFEMGIGDTAEAQWNNWKKNEITLANARPCDLLFYKSSSRAASHVSMHIGNKKIVHTTGNNNGVKIDSETWWDKKYIGIVRVLSDQQYNDLMSDGSTPVKTTQYNYSGGSSGVEGGIGGSGISGGIGGSGLDIPSNEKKDINLGSLVDLGSLSFKGDGTTLFGGSRYVKKAVYSAIDRLSSNYHIIYDNDSGADNLSDLGYSYDPPEPSGGWPEPASIPNKQDRAEYNRLCAEHFSLPANQALLCEANEDIFDFSQCKETMANSMRTDFRAYIYKFNELLRKQSGFSYMNTSTCKIIVLKCFDTEKNIEDELYSPHNFGCAIDIYAPKINDRNIGKMLAEQIGFGGIWLFGNSDKEGYIHLDLSGA